MLAHIERGRVPDGIQVVDLGFRFDGSRQHHIPRLIVEFDPVPVGAPNDAKDWKDRDAVADMLAAPAAPDGCADEQVAFEKWLYRTCPSGDVEAVQRQWEVSSDYADLTAAAPAAPDHSATQKRLDPDVSRILADNMHKMYEGTAPDRSATAPAEVPMPEPDMSVWDTEEVLTYSDECIQQYGVACRAAGEAAGYARGLKSRVPLDAINKMLSDCMDVAVQNGANSVSMPDHYVEVAAWVCGIKDAAKMMAEPAEVPMPEANLFGPAGTGDYFHGCTLDRVRQYGDAREAAGYARGMAAKGGA